MFADTVTLFNFHEKSGKWFPTVLSGVDLQVDSGAKLSSPGTVDSADTVTLLIHSKSDKSVAVGTGEVKTRKSYLGPKAYAQCENPEVHFTFKTECDFFCEGEWPTSEPIVDDDYDSGFYDEVNKERDGVYAVKNSAFLQLIPHFEVGGR